MIITTIGDEIGTTLEDQIEALKEVNMKYIEIRKIESMSSFWTQKRVIFTLTFFLFHKVFDILSLNVSFFCYTILL